MPPRSCSASHHLIRSRLSIHLVLKRRHLDTVNLFVMEALKEVMLFTAPFAAAVMENIALDDSSSAFRVVVGRKTDGVIAEFPGLFAVRGSVSAGHLAKKIVVNGVFHIYQLLLLFLLSLVTGTSLYERCKIMANCFEK